jgi:paraquat-inducible protein B
LRARLASTGILTGALKVELIEVEDAPAATVRKSAEGFPILPVTQSQISDAAATVEGVLNRVNSLPVEELLTSAIDFLNAASSFVSDEDFREAPQDLRGLISDVRGVVATDEVQAVAGNLNKVLIQVETLLVDLEQEQIVQRLTNAIDAASNAMEGVDQSIAGVPKLIDEMTQVVATARALPVTELITRLSALSDSTNALLLKDGVQELPAQLSAALAEVNATLTELREGGAITNVNATLASARDAADAVAVALTPTMMRASFII